MKKIFIYFSAVHHITSELLKKIVQKIIILLYSYFNMFTLHRAADIQRWYTICYNVFYNLKY